MVTDESGHITYCDPIVAHLEIPEMHGDQEHIRLRRKGKSRFQVSHSEPKLLIQNGSPGVRMMMIIINERMFGVVELGKGENTTISLDEGLTQDENSVQLTVYGKPGSSADIVIYGGN